MAGGTLLSYQKHKNDRRDFTAIPETQEWQERLYFRTRKAREVGKTLMSYQKHSDGRKESTTVPGEQGRTNHHARNTTEIGDTLLFYQEHKDGRRNFTAISRTQRWYEIGFVRYSCMICQRYVLVCAQRGLFV